MNLLRRAWTVYQNEGAAGIRKRGKRIRSQLFNYKWYYIHKLSITNDFELLPSSLIDIIERLGKRYEVEWLTEKSMEKLQPYLAYRQEPRVSEHKVLEWLRAGYATVMALDRGKIVGDCWMALDSFPFPASNRTLADIMKQRGYVYTFMAYVDPQYRAQGIFPLLLGEQVEFIRRKGKKGLIGTVLLRSKSSKKSLENMGFKWVGKLHIWRVVGREFSKVQLEEAPW